LVGRQKIFEFASLTVFGRPTPDPAEHVLNFTDVADLRQPFFTTFARLNKLLQI